ncbi:hypothetical protein [Streptomyces marispadix]|uniref:Uncharacterized protein n=1 Tax=Streptomyces marispadix TaxID=2922868 RepID=A0ABS9SUJ4_9ACTN|nr:hypothetical protein [Streptomyces marispadix]MCH6159956.1 hypothetical protein [Streptomyces marispadix]
MSNPTDVPVFFAPGQTDTNQYDRQALTYLVRECHSSVEHTLQLLESKSFEFHTTQTLHRDAIDVELIYRQCIPAACIATRYYLPIEEVADYLTLFTSCQTLILNHIDRHLDLSASYTIRDPQHLLADVRSVTCYAVASLYEGMTFARKGPGPAAAVSHMADVSSKIIQSMHHNYATRFDSAYLKQPEKLTELYRDETLSRHLGSGFYSSSVLGLNAYFDLPQPSNLPDILRDMRRLRQRVDELSDELSDLFEDTVTGLLTYPVAKLLISPEYHESAAKTILAIWEESEKIVAQHRGRPDHANKAMRTSGHLSKSFRDLMDLSIDAGVLEECRIEAHKLWCRIRGELQGLDSAIADPLAIVVDLKRAFLERLSEAAWNDDPPSHTFADIRRQVLEGRGPN